MSVLAICTKLQICAQEMPVAGSYTVNNTMTAFHGTWQWTAGTDTVRIYLITKKVYYPINGGYYMDDLVGWHFYKQGNTVIESSYSHINNFELSSIFVCNSESALNIANGSLSDLAKNKRLELKLTLNAAQNQLTWRSAPHQGMRIYSGNQIVPPPGFTLPRNMVLTKL
jgi:hypothetical protein